MLGGELARERQPFLRVGVDPVERLAPADPRADYIVPIPNTPAVIGASLTTQWIEWSQQASSNALTWTIDNTPTIQMAHVDGYATDARGELCVDLAHVVRFEHH